MGNCCSTPAPDRRRSAVAAQKALPAPAGKQGAAAAKVEPVPEVPPSEPVPEEAPAAEQKDEAPAPPQAEVEKYASPTTEKMIETGLLAPGLFSPPAMPQPAALKPAVYEFNAKLPASVESVWAVTGAAWCGDAIRGTLWEHFPAIAGVSAVEGPPEGAPGTLRRVDIVGGKVLHERLLTVDHAAHVATYTFEKPLDGNWDDHALGYRHGGMVVTLSLAAEEGATALQWVVKGEVDDEAALTATMDGFYNETSGFVSVINQLTAAPAEEPAAAEEEAPFVGEKFPDEPAALYAPDGPAAEGDALGDTLTQSIREDAELERSHSIGAF